MELLDESERLKELCERSQVGRLHIFGSAATGNFDAVTSDLDFLVSLEPQPAADYAENYLGLAHALEELFQRRVDLVTESFIRNRYFREAVEADRQLLYDRRGEKAVA